MSNSEELINPSEYTQKELVKMLYREMKELRADFEKYEQAHSDTHTQIQDRVKSLEDWRTTVEGQQKGKLDLTKWIGWLFAAGLGLLELYQLISQSGGL
jgi:hypothetical protein